MNRQYIIKVFQQIMGLTNLSEDTIQINQIGGMTNYNFKITLSNKSYVLRIPGNGTSKIIKRNNEDYNSRLAYRLNIAPKILYFDIESGIKSTPYIRGAETLNSSTIQHEDNLEKVITIIKLLHHSDVYFKNNFNIFEEIQRYENLLQQLKGRMYEGYTTLRYNFFSLSKILTKQETALVSCHNDLVPENFIKGSNGKIYLTDWEYSGINDPLCDIGSLFNESNFTEEMQRKALNIYHDGYIPEYISTNIFIYKILTDILWSIWTRIKETQGVDFGAYGIKRYQRAVRNLDYLNL